MDKYRDCHAHPLEDRAMTRLPPSQVPTVARQPTASSSVPVQLPVDRPDEPHLYNLRLNETYDSWAKRQPGD